MQVLPKLSIIIPTFNSAKTLEASLISLASQTFRDFEVLIIDGVSKDNTVAIAESFRAQLPSLTVISEPDKGIYDAMNKGIAKAEGDWLYFLGSDDRLLNENVLEFLTYSLIKHTNPLTILYGDVIFTEENRSTNHKSFTKYHFKNSNINHQCMFYNKEIFKNFGDYDLNYPIFADWDFNLKCFFSPLVKFSYIHLIIAYYSLNGSSNKISDDFMKNKNHLFKSLLKKLPLIDTVDFRLHQLNNSRISHVFLMLILQIIRSVLTLGKNK